MTTDPDQIRADITSLLAVLPDPDSVDADVEVIAERLEEAHDRLVQALESVETGRSAATREMYRAQRPGVWLLPEPAGEQTWLGVPALTRSWSGGAWRGRASRPRSSSAQAGSGSTACPRPSLRRPSPWTPA